LGSRGRPNHLLHLTAIKFLFSLLIVVAVAAGEQKRSASEGFAGGSGTEIILAG
jgi:hypothetical protein